MTKFRLKVAPYLALALAVLLVGLGSWLLSQGDNDGWIAVGAAAACSAVVVVGMVLLLRRGGRPYEFGKRFS